MLIVEILRTTGKNTKDKVKMSSVLAQVFSKYLTSSCYVTGTVSGPEYRTVNRRGKYPCPWEVYILGCREEVETKSINK